MTEKLDSKIRELDRLQESLIHKLKEDIQEWCSSIKVNKPQVTRSTAANVSR